ncbi:hypothetical protein SAMN04487968_103250 [Nocardioides terrae]|uniref:Peptidase MA superfamily n=1 Tax=Nocardioides terrae TaxID=574651 RepID=A0A1I1G3Q3_9ACTN|nr:hypothetical protein [Nocardioides terrae]SFC06479.1 hypothetical protein SAMN04487968_103250 [Nocardioides terrae]
MAGLVGLLALIVATVAWLVLKPDTYVATPPRAAQATARPDLAATALERLVGAITQRDADAAAGLAADPSGRSLLRAVVANASALDLTDLTARYVDEQGAVQRGGRWTAAVDLTWRFGRFDPTSVHEEVDLGFASDGHTARITGFGGGDRRTPLWLTGPVHVSRQAGVLTLGPDRASVDRYAKLAARAVTVVGRVVAGWAGPLVVEVPPSETALDAALGAAAGTYSGVAAVTATVDGSSAADAPVHVFLNPEVMATLDTQGAQIVVSHEATHAATKAATSSHRPIWLTEGFADYVALRDVRLPLSTTAGQILAQVRQSGPPDHLPDEGDFDSHSSSFGAEYEAAWLACRVIADRAGERGLLAVYDRVGAGDDLDAVLRDVVGVGAPGVTRLWQERLSHLAA